MDEQKTNSKLDIEKTIEAAQNTFHKLEN